MSPAVRRLGHSFLLVLLYLAAGVLTYGLVPHPQWGHARYGLLLMVQGEADNPFARRLLSPTLVRAIHAGIPATLQKSIETRVQDKLVRSGLVDPASPDTLKARRFTGVEGKWSWVVAGVILAVVSFAGFLLALRGLLVHFFSPPPWAADLLPLLAIPAIQPFNGYANFIYDYPQLALFTSALLLLAGSDWRMY